MAWPRCLKLTPTSINSPRVLIGSIICNRSKSLSWVGRMLTKTRLLQNVLATIFWINSFSGCFGHQSNAWYPHVRTATTPGKRVHKKNDKLCFAILEMSHGLSFRLTVLHYSLEYKAIIGTKPSPWPNCGTGKSVASWNFTRARPFAISEL